MKLGMTDPASIAAWRNEQRPVNANDELAYSSNMVADIVAKEREACAAVAESWSDYGVAVASVGPRIAAAIRARAEP